MNLFDNKKMSATSFNKMAKDYDSSWYGGYSKIIYKEVLQKINRFKYESILDVGCGTGELLYNISRLNNIKLNGLDISTEMIKVAKEKLGDIAELKVGDSEKIPWKSESFDLVVSTLSFHHYPNPLSALKEIYRIIRPGGDLILADVWLPTPLRQIANPLLIFSKEGDVKIYSKNEIISMMKDVGFEIKTYDRIKFIGYITVAQKKER